MPSQTPRIADKKSLKLYMLGLLGRETGQDYSALSRQLDVDVHCDTSVDSVGMVNIVLDLEAALGVKITTAELTPSRLRSLDRFAEHLLSKRARGPGLPPRRASAAPAARP
jgi:acyl carrier protein